MEKIKWYSKGKFTEEEYNPPVEPHLIFRKYAHHDGGSYEGYRYFLQEKSLILENVKDGKASFMKFSGGLDNISREEFELIKRNVIKISNGKSYNTSVYFECYWNDLLKIYSEEEFSYR